MERGAKIFSDVVEERGGLRVGDRRLGVSMTLIGDQSDENDASLATKYALDVINAHFLMAPYSSGLTHQAQLVSDTANRILMASVAADSHILGQSNLTFGTLPPATSWLKSSLNVISDRALAINASLTVGFFQSDFAVHKVVCSSGLAMAQERGFIANNATIPVFAAEGTLQEAKAVLSPMQAAGIDII
eukprot:6245665-Prymnesium_polylepis.1